MSARSLQKHHKDQKKRGNIDRRNQAKKDIDRALECRANDFASDARKITELYTRFIAQNDADGFAQAVIEYVNKSLRLVGYARRFCTVIDSHRYLQLPDDQAEEGISPRELEAQTSTAVQEQAKAAYEREQERLESMHREVQKLLRQLSEA